MNATLARLKILARTNFIMTSRKTSQLSEKQRKNLRRLGHALNPVILIGDKGLTESLIAECDRTIAHHELIKVKARGRDRASRDALFATLCSSVNAQLVQSVGMTALIYRPDPKQPKIDINH